jgi:hypothetical protein
MYNYDIPEFLMRLIMKPLDKYIKYSAYISIVLLIIGLIPMIAIGFFTHPLGDDYHYGQYAAEALRESGNILSVFPEAIKGMVEQYNTWQGTYFAMFLMYLPPHVFSDFLYKLYPALLILFFCASVFFLIKPIAVNATNSNSTDGDNSVKKDKTPIYSWISISSMLCIISILQIPVCGEAFYWFNGSIYYMGFLSMTFFLFGVLFRYIINPKIYLLIIALILGFLIAGGNYASLLPAILILICLIIFSIQTKKNMQAKGLIAVLVVMIIGLIISMIAPGNAMRAATTAGTTPIKAIVKSIIQCSKYVIFFNGPVSLLGFAFLAPILVNVANKSSFTFKNSIINCIISFGIFCSSVTAVFYGQNNGGPARLFDICIVMLYVMEAYIIFSLIGFVVSKRKTSSSDNSSENAIKSSGEIIKRIAISTTTIIAILFAILIIPNILSKSIVVPNSYTAIKLLINGDAASYDSEYKNRLKQIANNPNSDLVFKPYTVSNDLEHFLYLGDLSSDPCNFNNEAFAKFYNLNSVYVDYTQ